MDSACIYFYCEGSGTACRVSSGSGKTAAKNTGFTQRWALVGRARSPAVSLWDTDNTYDLEPSLLLPDDEHCPVQ